MIDGKEKEATVRAGAGRRQLRFAFVGKSARAVATMKEGGRIEEGREKEDGTERRIGGRMRCERERRSEG